MYNRRDNLKNILRYVDFNRLWNIIKQFTELNLNIVKEVINFNLSVGSRKMKKQCSSSFTEICGPNWYKNISWIHNFWKIVLSRLSIYKSNWN